MQLAMTQGLGPARSAILDTVLSVIIFALLIAGGFWGFWCRAGEGENMVARKTFHFLFFPSLMLSLQTPAALAIGESWMQVSKTFVTVDVGLMDACCSGRQEFTLDSLGSSALLDAELVVELELLRSCQPLTENATVADGDLAQFISDLQLLNVSTVAFQCDRCTSITRDIMVRLYSAVLGRQWEDAA